MSVGNRLRTGILHINDQTVGDDVFNPFGGVGASGNGSSIGGPANWEEFHRLAMGHDRGNAARLSVLINLAAELFLQKNAPRRSAVSQLRGVQGQGAVRSREPGRSSAGSRPKGQGCAAGVKGKKA